MELDSLEIKVQSSSQEAASGLDKLAASLVNLKSAAKGGAGLSTLAKGLERINTSLSGTGLNGSKIQSLVSALSSLSQIQKASGLNSVVNSLKKLPDISSNLDKLDLDKFASQIQRVATAMKPLATEMEKVSNGFKAFPIRIQRLIQSNNSLTASNTKTARSFNLLSTGINLYVLQRAASIMSDWVKESNDYVENLNLFTVAMGEYAVEAKAYAEEVQAAMGIDPSEWMRNQGVFMQMASGFGVATDSAALMSKNLTQLGYDISSFYNISIEDAMQKLQSGFAGEIEPLRRLGYAIDIASLEQVALNHGITESVNAMSQAEKSQLRYVAIMEQSTNAMGDMARTIQTPANAMRILNQQITQLSRALGNMLIPILQQIIPWVQAFVLVLTDAAQAIANFLGFTLPTIDYSGLDGVSVGASSAEDALTGAGEAAKEMKRQLLGIDELNIIAPNASAGGAGAGASAGSDLGLNLPEYDFLQGLESQTDEYKKKLESILKVVLAIGAAFAAWKIATGIANGIVGIKTGLDGIKAAIGLVAGSGAWAAIQSVLNWIAGAIAAIVIQFNAAGGGAAGLLSVIKLIAGALATPATVIALIAAQLVNLWTGSEKFRKGIERIGEVIQGVFAVVGDVLGGIFTVLGDIAEGFINLLPDPVKDLIVGAIETIKDWIGQLDLGFGDLAITIAGVAFLFVPGGQVLGVILLAFEAITVGLRALGGISAETWESIKGKALDAWNNIKSGAADLWESIKSGIKSAWENVVDFFTESLPNWWNETIAPWFTVEKWAELGKQAIDGLFKGLSNMWGRVKSWGSNLLSDVKSVLGIHSPSVEFEAIGKYSLEGFFRGTKGLSEISDAFRSQISSIQSYAASGYRSAAESGVSAARKISTALKSVPSSGSYTVEPTDRAVFLSRGEATRLSFAYSEGSGAFPKQGSGVFAEASGRDVINAVMAMGSMIVKAIQEQDTSTYLDGRMVSRMLYDYNRQTDRDMGSHLIKRGNGA